jgi:aryl-alcohol dehydrogenase-like predicted oxidoreductase
MDYRKLGPLSGAVSNLALGTWSFGGGVWWGKQNDADSIQVLETALAAGINIIDTAPVYGKGRSERVIGAYLRKRRIRQEVLIATKVGLSWDGPRIYHDLSKKRVLAELDESRKRLDTDYFDLYQIHWPDPATPIAETAEVMNDLFEKKIIRAIGVSNFSVEEMSLFMKQAPLHCLQPEYSMFNRSIEKDVIPFCLDNQIAVISYAPLYSGLLTGKFFFKVQEVPNDRNRRMKQCHLQEPLFSINRDALYRLKEIASGYGKSLTQLAINWNINQPGVTSAIAGMRRASQVEDNLGGVGWLLSSQDQEKVNKILNERQEAIAACR